MLEFMMQDPAFWTFWMKVATVVNLIVMFGALWLPLYPFTYYRSRRS